MCHYKVMLKISLKSAHNLLSNGRISDARDTQQGDPDHYQNLITCSFYHTGPIHKISLQSVDNVLSSVANRHTRMQKDRQINKPSLPKQ